MNGQFRQASSFTIEWVDNDCDNGNLTVVVPWVEAIQTVDVTTSNYDAAVLARGERHWATPGV
ncbi:MAG: hypothetical protein JWN34_6182 [Bryobacterales bacterium]|nr:hypothetical protein [Bryobacterales bacterium]